MAGGTGGHIFPAQSVCEHLRAHRLVWLGRPGGLEQRVAGKVGAAFLGFEFCSPRDFRSWWSFVSQLWRACRRISAHFGGRRPDLVVGFGGYYSVPGALVALWKRIPLVIQEQNSRPGLANRLLALWARRILTAYPGTFARWRRAVWMGNPLRAGHGSVPRPARSYPRTKEPGTPWRVLVLGGSQGAQTLNTLMPGILVRLYQSGTVRPGLRARHFCGQRDLEKTARAYAAMGGAVAVEAFSETMHKHYDWADFAVCRGGAMTLSELAHHALPAIVVPLASATGDHQCFNAFYYAKAGGVTVLRDDASASAHLDWALRDLFRNCALLPEMSMAMRSVAHSRVAGQMAELLLSCCALKPERP